MWCNLKKVQTFSASPLHFLYRYRLLSNLRLLFTHLKHITNLKRLQYIPKEVEVNQENFPEKGKTNFYVPAWPSALSLCSQEKEQVLLGRAARWLLTKARRDILTLPRAEERCPQVLTGALRAPYPHPRPNGAHPSSPPPRPALLSKCPPGFVLEDQLVSAFQGSVM